LQLSFNNYSLAKYIKTKKQFNCFLYALMVAIFLMCMVMYPAGSVIDQVCSNNKQNSGDQEPELPLMPNLLGKQQCKTITENKDRYKAMVMFFPAMIKGIGTNAKSHSNHEVFKAHVVNQFHTKQGEAGGQQWQYGTVDSTCHRSHNTQRIPIDLEIHKSANIINAILLQKLFFS
jgi:hypothetical protein